MFTLTKPQFELLYLCLQKDNVLNNIPLTIKTDSVVEEEKITKTFYNDYSVFKRELFRDLVKLNMKNDVFRSELQKEDSERANKNIKQHLFKKSQKLIDRFLFIFFAEDRGLLPPNSTVRILQDWDKLKDLDTDIPLYNRFKLYFKYLDEGRKGTDKKAEIFAYNGGLFKPDPILDSLILTDALLYKHTKTLSDYDFESQVDVNILGHIFENSLNEIESVNAEIEGVAFDKQKTKRKKDGVFYTPKYITKYIVDNTIGKLCEEKKTELAIIEADFNPKRQKETKKKLLTALESYREWLLQLTICDPACGSGAFLNQALDFLIKEHRYVDELQTNLLGGGLVFPNIENTVLENNIFGVDLNEESVEIAKLSLWLRTAQPRRKLNSLNNNIKCGNSLIDSKAVAGDKAFHWETQFPKVFNKAPKQLFLVTFVTHNSRISDRMVAFNPPEFIKDLQPFAFKDDDYTKMIALMGEGISKYNIPTVSFTVLPDHVHLLCTANNETELNEQIRKLKGFTSYEFQRYKKWNKGEHKVWAQKFHRKTVPAEATQVTNVVDYITKNVPKHSERWGKTIVDNGLKPIAALNNTLCVPFETAIQNKGGFDVVIGNPPYGAKLDNKTWLKKHYKATSFGNIDSYKYFIQLGTQLVKKNGVLGYIMPDSYLEKEYFKDLRIFTSENFKCIINIKMGDDVFEEVNLPTSIILLNNKGYSASEYFFLDLSNTNAVEKPNCLIDKNKFIINKPKVEETFIVIDSIIKSNNTVPLIEVYNQVMGVKTYQKGKGKPKQTDYEKKEDIFISNIFSSVFNYPYVSQGINRYSYQSQGEYISYGEWLAEPRKKEFFDKPKLVIREIINPRIFATYIEKPAVVKNIAAVITEKKESYPIKFLLALLNSNLFTYYVNEQSPKSNNKSYPSFNSRLLKQLPIVMCDEEEKVKLINKVNFIIKVINELIVSSNKFQKYLQSQYPIQKLPKKLQNWHELAFGEFIKELNKAIKKENKPRRDNGLEPLATLTKTQEMDWMDVFETKKAEAQALQAQIQQTDKEIDQMVYKLYELTDEEIAIVEAS